MMENLLKLGRIQYGIAVPPNGNRSTRSDNALRLAKKRIGIEPVKRLRNRDKID